MAEEKTSLAACCNFFRQGRKSQPASTGSLPPFVPPSPTETPSTTLNQRAFTPQPTPIHQPTNPAIAHISDFSLASESNIAEETKAAQETAKAKSENSQKLKQIAELLQTDNTSQAKKIMTDYCEGPSYNNQPTDLQIAMAKSLSTLWDSYAKTLEPKPKQAPKSEAEPKPQPCCIIL